MSNITPQTSGIRIVEKEVKVPSRLSDDTSPVLSGNLNANNKDIQDANDVQAKTINGIDIIKWIRDEFLKLSAFVSSGFATKKHSHEMEDIADLSEELGSLSMNIKAETEDMGRRTFAALTHLHQAESIQGLRDFVTSVISSVPVRSHSHKELESSLAAVAISLSNVGELIAEAISKSGLRERINRIDEDQTATLTAMRKLKEEVEAIRFAANRNDTITIDVGAKSKDSVEVITSDEPYVILPSDPKKYDVNVTDASGKELQVEFLDCVVNFKRTKGPYKITFYKK